MLSLTAALTSVSPASVSHAQMPPPPPPGSVSGIPALEAIANDAKANKGAPTKAPMKNQAPATPPIPSSGIGKVPTSAPTRAKPLAEPLAPQMPTSPVMIVEPIEAFRASPVPEIPAVPAVPAIPEVRAVPSAPAIMQQQAVPPLPLQGLSDDLNEPDFSTDAFLEADGYQEQFDLEEPDIELPDLEQNAFPDVSNPADTIRDDLKVFERVIEKSIREETAKDGANQGTVPPPPLKEQPATSSGSAVVPEAVNLETPEVASDEPETFTQTKPLEASLEQKLDMQLEEAAQQFGEFDLPVLPGDEAPKAPKDEKELLDDLMEEMKTEIKSVAEMDEGQRQSEIEEMLKAINAPDEVDMPAELEPSADATDDAVERLMEQLKAEMTNKNKDDDSTEDESETVDIPSPEGIDVSVSATSEDDAEAEEMAEPTIPVPVAKPNYLTPSLQQGPLIERYVLPAAINKDTYSKENSHLPPKRTEAHLVKSMHLKAAQGDMNAVRALLDHGVDVDIPDRNRNTALILAANSGQFATVQLLLARGAELDYQNMDGFTAMHVAAAKNNAAIATLLKDAGANLNIEDYRGFSAADYARAANPTLASSITAIPTLNDLLALKVNGTLPGALDVYSVHPDDVVRPVEVDAEAKLRIDEFMRLNEKLGNLNQKMPLFTQDEMAEVNTKRNAFLGYYADITHMLTAEEALIVSHVNKPWRDWERSYNASYR